MKRFIILAAAAVIAVTATPALAKSKKKYPAQSPYYGESYVPFGYWAGYGAPIKGFGPSNDPSLGHPSAPDSRARAAAASRISATVASSIAAGERLRLTIA